MFGASAAKVGYNANSDVEVSTPPDMDGVSSLAFSPTANFLIATTWNNRVLCWEIQPNGTSVAKAQNTDHTQPPLCSCWNTEGSAVFSGGCDKAVRLWNLSTSQSQQIGSHDAPVRHCFYVKEMNVLVTGGWDKTVKYWDLRSPNPVHTQALPDRVYAMDVLHPLLVVGTADRNIHVINLTSPQQIFKSTASQLKWQTRCVSCFPDKQGFLVGSIEGRVAVQHIDEQIASQKNFTFKCHRDNADIYAVNQICFHPTFGTFVTAGSDGTFNFWDKDTKQRLKAMSKCMYGTSPAPIPCGSFNRDGSIYAYAVSYDWSRGHAEYNPATMKNAILLHPVKEDDVKAKPKAPATTASRR